ncbi:hypothetical protein [Glutamicibacter halophytocola]|uniref:hypothetical protein n=1 Tax=Glutamicibacter halophytocola TaxID=1933880 RepID=UPI0015C52BCE|nr:hypothetical protein [Glutamicibacter halophytocola]NQD40514.1 hypothetical protein [Glutamicibacter halophytocola]
MSANTADLDKLIHDLGKIPAKVERKVMPIMRKTGIQTKRRLQAELGASKSFKAAARSVDYEVTTHTFGDASIIQVEVGPNAHKHSAAALAGIAYFGGSRGGGGTVPDPIVAMRQEEPVLLGFLEMAVEGLI